MAAAAVAPVLAVLIAVGAAAISSRPAVLPADCGGRLLTPDDVTRPLIVGDGNTTAFYGQFPWQARITVFKGRSHVHQCGGTIITRRHVLTAAHCVHDVALSSVRVHVGDNRLGVTESAEEVFTVSGLFVHGHYGTGTSHANDIALLRLKVRRGSGIVFGWYVQPACLPEEGVELEANTRCEVSGWGWTADRGPLSDVLRGASVPLVSDQFCSASEVYRSGFIEGRTVCAGEVRGGPDACNGDSGGPLVCRRPSDGRFIAYGIVSSGDPQGCGRLPGLYTKVSGFLDWLLPRLRLDDDAGIGLDTGVEPTPECGVSNVGLPVNVTHGRADRADFPWLIAISRSGRGSLGCPATLLSDRWMVSSSTCTKSLSNAQLPFRAVLHFNKDAPSVSLSIVRRVVHPKYSSIFPGYDMALLQTVSPIPLSSRLRPICLADEQLSAEQTIVTAAWKSEGSFSFSPDPVRWKKLAVMNPTACLRFFGRFHGLRNRQDVFCGIFRPKRSNFDCGRSRVEFAAPLMTSSVQDGAKRWYLVSFITQGVIECEESPFVNEIHVGMNQTVQWIRSIITN